MFTYIFLIDNAYKDDANLNDLLCKLIPSLKNTNHKSQTIPVGNFVFCFHPVDNVEYTLDLKEDDLKDAYVFYHANIKLDINNHEQACVYKFPFHHSRYDFIYTTLTEIIDILINISQLLQQNIENLDLIERKIKRNLSPIEEELSKLRKLMNYTKLPYYLFIRGLKHYLDQGRVNEAKELITEDKLKLIKNEELKEDIRQLKDVDLTEKDKESINNLIGKLDQVLNDLNKELFGKP